MTWGHRFHPDPTDWERNMPLAGVREKPTSGNQPGARTQLPARVAMLGDIGYARHRLRGALHAPRGLQTFHEEPDSEDFRLCGPDGLCHNYSVLPCNTKTATDGTGWGKTRFTVMRT